MGIGAIGAIGTYQPYVYNTNKVDATSLNKISAISDDALDSSIDQTGLLDDVENINPLKKGETSNFNDLFEMQMQMAQHAMSRVVDVSVNMGMNM